MKFDLYNPDKLRDKALNEQQENKSFFKKINKKRFREIDKIVHELHNDAFEEIDCLKCANCCKSISPRLIDKDIERISGFLKIKPSEFVDKYLDMDDDGDYVFKETPCPFLASDNYCLVYNQRPRACKEYPHTDRKKFMQIMPLAIKNTEYCPAVYLIIRELKIILDK